MHSAKTQQEAVLGQSKSMRHGGMVGYPEAAAAATILHEVDRLLMGAV